tara:strand:+ start:11052 stop:11654 length:603 start_codon:yes stop_codon:yes gene_type:complete
MIKFFLIILLFPWLCFADDQLAFTKLVDNMQTLKGSFSQKVIDSKNNVIQDVEGSFLFKKPNFFKWNYDRPFKSQIICDGELLYLYDPDLKQVVISALQKLGGVSPAMLLVSSSATDHFDIKTLEKAKLKIFEAIPKKIQDSTFKKVTIYFDDAILSEMHILDNLEHRTEIHFNQLESNKEINEGSFLFNVPEDVDVIKN